MMLLTRDVLAELGRGGLIDITTTGRRTGQPRRIEMTFHHVDGRVVISGHPGRPRDWLANLAAKPSFTFHLKGRLVADLPARARVITDADERDRLLRPIARAWGIGLEQMVASAPLVEVMFD
jgi:deazaflavin-dependent oxidoreductase (nitroreductase family)